MIVENKMNKRQEKVLVAMLCGLVIVSAGAFAVHPALASASHTSQVERVATLDLGPIDLRR
jgi:hypothetical protein